MISGITITCFAASYGIALILEVSRLFFRARIRMFVLILFATAGLLAHSLFLIAQVKDELSSRALAPLSSWHDFCLVAAWVLAGAYLGLLLRRPENAVGLFLLPTILIMVFLAAWLYDQPPFPERAALNIWRLIHGISLLVGTVAVLLGFATGLMYLIQAYRLKHKLPPKLGFRLPPLEWLQRFNRETLFASTFLLAIGLISGVVLNLIATHPTALVVAWTDPVVLSSAVLFIWLATVACFELLYRPARQGQKIAYLTLGHLIFLGLALFFVLSGEHASTAQDTRHHTPNTRIAVRDGVLSPVLDLNCESSA